MKQQLYYLDHAAATPVDVVVLESMQPYFSEKFFNPSSPYSAGVEVKRDYLAAKQKIAQVIGVQKDEIVMTAGATESINIAFSATSGACLVAATEHAAVLAAAGRVGEVVKVTPNKKGRINPEDVRRALTPEVQFVSIGLVNNELGTIQSIEEIAKIVEAEKRRRTESGEKTPLLFHSDASQAAALMDVKPKRLGVDLLTLSAAKVYGPKQVGLLWVKPGVVLRPTVVGGGQEMGLRSGTENVAGVVGFAVALELAAKRRNSEVKRLKAIRDDMQQRLTEDFPELIFSSDNKKGLVSFLNFSLPGIDAERLIFMLEKKGVMLATGSACAANSGTKSHILEAIGLDDQEIAGSLRISLGRLSTEENCREATQLIIEAINSEKARLAK